MGRPRHRRRWVSRATRSFLKFWIPVWIIIALLALAFAAGWVVTVVGTPRGP